MTSTARESDAQHLDVLVVGAGMSGIGVAKQLLRRHPRRTVALLEERDEIGGTWSLFRYPGVRSDSDLAIYAYRSRPWMGEKCLADGPDILRYVQDVARETGVDRLVRYGHRVRRASWSTPDARWSVEVEVAGEIRVLTCSWLICATGYYRYDEGYTPALPGVDRYAGTLVHPQHWPVDLDTAGKRIVVIGSGATAVTLVPALTRTAEHVTMLQRSPSYIVPLPSRDKAVTVISRFLGARAAGAVARRKALALQRTSYRVARTQPERFKKTVRGLQQRMLPEDFDFAHLTPSYQPWDQRLCVVPDGDLFRAVRKGAASIVTDRIVTFTEKGLLLESGAELEADVVVTATGLQLLAFGGIALDVDGQPVEPGDALTYKGLMLSGVPNFVYVMGYTNSSWTLKVDLVAEHLCRLLKALDRAGADWAVPQRPDDDLPTRPLLDMTSGYLQRSVDDFPRRALQEPWSHNVDYAADVRLLVKRPVLEPALRTGRAGTHLPAGGRAAARANGPG